MQFKIVLVGDAKSGKTSLLKRLCTGEFTEVYSPTLGVEVRNFICNTNYGKITFNVWDTAGQEKFSGVFKYEGESFANSRWVYKSDFFNNEPFQNIDGALIFADFTSKQSLKHAEIYNKEVLNVNPNTYTILLVNKVDVPKSEKKISIENISKSDFKRKFCVSAKSNYNFEKGFLYLAREITGKDDLVFTEGI